MLALSGISGMVHFAHAVQVGRQLNPLGSGPAHSQRSSWSSSIKRQQQIKNCNHFSDGKKVGPIVSGRSRAPCPLSEEAKCQLERRRCSSTGSRDAHFIIIDSCFDVKDLTEGNHCTNVSNHKSSGTKNRDRCQIHRDKPSNVCKLVVAQCRRRT